MIRIDFTVLGMAFATARSVAVQRAMGRKAQWRSNNYFFIGAPRRLPEPAAMTPNRDRR